MFFHMYKYRLKTLFNQKEEFFWILLFPIILGTFFFLAFADITKKNETFETINIAVVKENTEAEVFFDAMMESLAVTDDDAKKAQAMEIVKALTDKRPLY